MKKIEVSSDILFNKNKMGIISIVYLNENSDFSDKVLHLEGVVADTFMAINEGLNFSEIIKKLQNLTQKTEEECNDFLNIFLTDMTELKVFKVNE